MVKSLYLSNGLTYRNKRYTLTLVGLTPEFYMRVRFTIEDTAAPCGCRPNQPTWAINPPTDCHPPHPSLPFIIITQPER